MSIIYFEENGVVKGKFVNCDTNSSKFKNMKRIEVTSPDESLELSFKNFKKTLPPRVEDTTLKNEFSALQTDAEKIDYMARKLGLK